MKTKAILLFMLTLTASATVIAQKSSVKKNIKMYSQVWDDILNKRQLDMINEAHFQKEVLLKTQPEDVVGLDNFKAYYSNFLTGFSDIEFRIISIFGQGDQLVKHWNFKGTHSGEFFGIPATGKSVNLDGVTLVTMKNGKVAQEQDFMDNSIFMQQLGLLSNPENMNIIDGMYKSFSTGDIPAVLEKMDPGIVWNEAEGNPYADGNPYIGPDAVLNGVFARIGAEYEYFTLAGIQLHEMANNQVLATLRYQAKLKKNAAVMNAQAAHLWTLKEGKVISFQQYTDTKQLADYLEQ